MLLSVNEKTYQPQALRPYQDDAKTAIQQAWAAHEAPIAALATGAGKTTIIAEVLRDEVDPAKQRALVIGHTTEIVHQLYDRIQNQFEGRLNDLYGMHMQPGIGMVLGETDVPDARIVVASRQSLHPKRLKTLLRTGAFDVFIIDEAHHALADNTYGKIVETLKEANPKLRILGVSATPKRTDKKALGSIFTSICYEWLIPQGIAAGYLVPVTRVKVKTQVNVSHIKSVAGDYNERRLISALDAANWEALCVESYMQHIHVTQRPTLAFMPSVEMSKSFALALRSAGVPAAHIDGTTDKNERRSVLADYQAGRLRVVSNMAVLTEGFDAPSTAAIFLGRPTRSSTLLTQIVGRGLRPFPGKHDCLLLDMTVVDTKALEVGTLFGKLFTCEECGAEYYTSLPKCPQCGTERPAKKLRELVEDNALLMFGAQREFGDSLVSDYAPLFEKAFAAWYHGSDGFMSCTLSFEDGAYIIVPPLEDNYYRLVHVPKQKDAQVSFLQRNEDLTALMMDADVQIRDRASNGADKEAPWRSQPPSIAQVDLLRKLGVNLPDGLLRGAASQLITHHIAVKRLLEQG